MAVVPHSIDIVVASMASSLSFYRMLGLPVPDGLEEAEQAQIETPGGASISEAMMKGHNPHWIDPVGQRVTFACRCDSVAEVDETYAKMAAAGYEGRQEPWDSPWGQRYAMLGDPDGNRVDLFAELSKA
jgi:predicted enzyme related to lactoylglutathione lyase